ncbi:MAG: diaminopimelate epimerase [Candidatus Aminicenantes bacterium RBG_19FT_COMBO_65_30]|nr:MAG: diaminopimelate epimerase [Candidatus Aminicenantes bacterium RBG_19FT_COMBO_65_30]
MRFTKLHALGNDFLVVGPGEESETAAAGELARRICDRHTGVGGDGLIFLSAEAVEPARAAFRIFNADGSEAEISGNGLRCAAAFLASSGIIASPKVLFRTAAGERLSEILSSKGALFEVRIGLGVPRLTSKDIPFDDGQAHNRIVDYPLSIIRRSFPVTCLSMGNPHCSLFLDAFPSHSEWRGLGSEIETHPFFPRRTNVEFVRVHSRDEIEVLFWERGVGETLASGTGSAAAAAASIIKGLVNRAVTVRTARGSLKVEWPEGGEILQTGPAEVVFSGDYPAV